MKMEVKITHILLTSLVACLFLLTSCTFNPFTTHNHTTGSATGALIGAGAGAGGVALFGGSKTLMVLAGLGGGALGYYVTTLRYDAGGVIQSGGQVYQVGDFVGVYIPSDQLFEVNTSDFLPQASGILDSVVTVLQRNPDNNILISGNTSGFGLTKWEQQLSEKRAAKVASYLWNAGLNQFKNKSIDTRKLTYVGYGDYFPLTHHETNDAIRRNSRIQITSYPSRYNMGLSKREVAVKNMGAMNNDNDISQAPRGGCGLKGEC